MRLAQLEETAIQVLGIGHHWLQLASDLNAAYTNDFVNAAAAVERLDPAAFARLGINLKNRGLSLSRWEETVHSRARQERDRIKQAQGPVHGAGAIGSASTRASSVATELVELVSQNASFFHDGEECFAVINEDAHV
jgi:hypothetical protein